MIIHALLL